jgi:hypothetical protein
MATTDRAAEETLVVSVNGIAHDDAGIVLRLSSVVQTVEPVRASLEIGWATDETGGTTVVVIGALSESSDLLLVSRRASPEIMRADIVEVSDAEGDLSRPSSASARVRPLNGN